MHQLHLHKLFINVHNEKRKCSTSKSLLIKRITNHLVRLENNIINLRNKRNKVISFTSEKMEYYTPESYDYYILYAL